MLIQRLQKNMKHFHVSCPGLPDVTEARHSDHIRKQAARQPSSRLRSHHSAVAACLLLSALRLWTTEDTWSSDLLSYLGVSDH